MIGNARFQLNFFFFFNEAIFRGEHITIFGDLVPNFRTEVMGKQKMMSFFNAIVGKHYILETNLNE